MNDCALLYCALFVEQRRVKCHNFLQIDRNIALGMARSVQNAGVVLIGALQCTDHQRLHRPVVFPERVVLIEELDLGIDVADL